MPGTGKCGGGTGGGGILHSGGTLGHCPAPWCGTEEAEEVFLAVESGGHPPCQSLSV